MYDTPATCFGRHWPSSGRWLTKERIVANYVRGVQLIIIIIHSFICLTCSQSFTKWVLRKVRSIASSFNFQYPVFSLRSPSGCLSLLPRLPATSILACISPSIKCFRREFLRKMWSVQLPFLFLYCLYLIRLPGLCITSSFLTQSVYLFSILLQRHTSKLPRYLCLVS